MPQVYVRKEKGYADVSHDAMLLAVKDVVEGGMSLRKAAEAHAVSKSVLGRYVSKHRTDPSVRLEPNYSHSKVFTVEEEEVLSDYLTQCSKMFHGLTHKQTRQVAYQMAVKNGKQFPASWTENEEAGREWMKAFMNRNPQLTLRKPEATSIARAGAFNRHNVGEFFTNLTWILKQTGVSGMRIVKSRRNRIHDCPETCEGYCWQRNKAGWKGHVCREGGTGHDVCRSDCRWVIPSPRLRLPKKDSAGDPDGRHSGRITASVSQQRLDDT